MISLLLMAVVAFIASYFIAPKYIRFLHGIGLTGTDIQKANKPKIAESGALIVLVGLLSGTFLFVWIMTFLYGALEGVTTILVAISTILITMLIGFFDDLSALGGQRDQGFKRVGLPQWSKPLLTLPAAIPLMALMAGDTTMTLPFLGPINFGILYPLVLVPLGVIGAANATNMLAGFNGLEAGLGAVLLGTLGIYGLINGQVIAIVALSMAAALLAFLRFNWYPAKIMPGDSLTYMIGVSVAVVAIVGNMEKLAILCFLPWFLEFALKLRVRFKAENFGKIQSDGTLAPPYKKNYSVTHLVMHLGRFKEWQVSGLIILGEILLCVFMFFMIS